MSTVLSFLHLVKCKRFVDYEFGGQVTPLYTVLKFLAINFHIIIHFLRLSKQYDKITLHSNIGIFYYLRFLQYADTIRHHSSGNCKRIFIYYFICLVYLANTF